MPSWPLAAPADDRSAFPGKLKSNYRAFFGFSNIELTENIGGSAFLDLILHLYRVRMT